MPAVPAEAAVTGSENRTVTALKDSEPLTLATVGATTSGLTVRVASGLVTSPWALLNRTEYLEPFSAPATPAME